jgi:hypothetical protein
MHREYYFCLVLVGEYNLLYIKERDFQGNTVSSNVISIGVHVVIKPEMLRR